MWFNRLLAFVGCLSAISPAFAAAPSAQNHAALGPSSTLDGRRVDSVLATLDQAKTYADQVASKVDTANGVLTNPTINGQTIASPLLQASAVRAANGVAGLNAAGQVQTAPVRKSVFIGSARTADMILLEKNADVLINSGRVGLYGHWNAMYSLTTTDLAAIGKYWAPTQSGFGGYGNFQAQAELGAWTNFADGTIQAKYGGQLPQEINVNLYNAGAGDDTSTYVDPANGKTYACYSTSQDLQNVKASVDAMFAVGAKNYAVVSSPNCGTVDFDQPFATGDFWANTRAMALYGGGITMDTSPGLFFNHQSVSQYGDTDIAAKYTDMVAQMIRWGNQQGLRTTIIMPPNAQNPNDSQFDPDYLNAAMSEVDYLRAHDAIPSEFVVEQYGLTDNGANAPWGDYVDGSMNRLARYLLTVKTPDGGGTAPQAPGGLPGNQLMTVNVPYTPEAQIPDDMGSLGHQSSNDVRIHGGHIGDTYSNSSQVYVALMPGSTFLTDVPLTFQGGGSYGNQSLEGGNDNWMHITNHYNSDPSKIGMAFGSDTAAPILSRDTAGNVSVSTGIDFSGGTSFKPITFQGAGSKGNPSIGGGNDNWLHLMNLFNSDPTNIGMAFGTDAAAPVMSRDAGGNVSVSTGLDYSGGTVYKLLQFFSADTDVSGLPALTGGVNDHFLHIADGFTNDPTLIGLMFNTGEDMSKPAFGGFSGIAGGLGLSAVGQIFDVQGFLHLKNMSKADILASPQSWDGLVVNDVDDHVPVIRENGSWYPIQLGAALTQ